MAIGFIALHRKIRDNWIWEDAEKFKWWSDMLLEANWEAEPVRVCLGGTSFVMCGRGQVCFSVLTWMKRWRASREKVRHFFRALEATNMITIETTTVTTIITICNYDSYNKPATNKATTKQPAEQPQYNKGNNSITTPKGVVEHTQAEKDSFKRFQDWIKEHAPRVALMKKPFTITEYLKIKKTLLSDRFPQGADAGKKFMCELLTSMENWEPLYKNRSAYLTFTKWAKRDLSK